MHGDLVPACLYVTTATLPVKSGYAACTMMYYTSLVAHVDITKKSTGPMVEIILGGSSEPPEPPLYPPLQLQFQSSPGS